MALAPVTWTSQLGESKVGHFTLVYGTTDNFKLTTSDSGGGTVYTMSEPIDTDGYDSCVFKVITVADSSGASAFTYIAALAYDETASTALATGDRVHALQGTSGHTIETVSYGDLDTVDSPSGATAGSGNDSYLTGTVGWVDLRTAGRHIIIAGLAGTAGTSAKIEVQLHSRRK